MPAAIPARALTPAEEQGYQENILVAAKGGGIAFFGRIFEYVIRFLFSIIIARWIGAEQYGLYTLGLTIAPIASTFALLGLQTGIVHYLPPAIRENDQQRIWGIIQVGAGIPALLSFIFGIILFFLAEPIAVLAFQDPRLVPLLQIVSISIPLEAIGFIIYQVIISYKQPKYSVLANNIVMPVAKLVLSVGFLAAGMGVWGIVAAHVIATAIGMAMMFYYMNSLFSLRRPFAPAVRRTGELLRYSLPVHLAYVFNTLRGTLETLILGLVGLTAGVGIYSVALRLSVLGSLLFLAIGNISSPIIADLYSRGDIRQMKSFYKTTTKWILMFNIPLFLTFALFGEPILSIFGADFTEGAPGLLVLTFGTLVYTGTGLGANILDMTNHTRINSVNSIIMVVLTITLDLLLIPRWGVLGAAAAAAFSTVLVNVICLLEVWFVLKMQPYQAGILKSVAAGLIAASLTYLVAGRLTMPPLLLLVVGSSILWSIYALLMIVMGFSKEDHLVIDSIRARLRAFSPVKPQVVK